MPPASLSGTTAVPYHLSLEIWTNSSLGIPPSTFSLYDALDPGGQYSNLETNSDDLTTAYVFESACGPPGGPQNCTETCTDPKSAFQNLFTLRNCIAYPTIAYYYDIGNLSVGDQSIADGLVIEKSGVNDSVSVDVITTIETCLQKYCEVSLGNECSSGLTEWNIDYSDTSMFNQTSTFYIKANYTNTYGYDSIFDLCEYLPSNIQTVNQDVGGIGVCR